MTTARTWLTDDPEADALLARDDAALLVGMLLDQQVPMEKAFAGPGVIAERLGGRFDPASIAAMGEDEFVELCSRRPAVHRFPAAMAKRVRRLCQILVADYDGQASQVWAAARTGAELRDRLSRLPGFGPDKAAIFTALLGKRRGVTPPGWREAAGPYGEEGVYRSVADVVDLDSRQRVRDTKRAAKAAARAQAGEPGG